MKNLSLPNIKYGFHLKSRHLIKKHLLLFLLLVLGINGYSQISFEKGYYINDANQRIDCLIKNMDWINTPTQFEYKLSEHGETKIGTMAYTKEFGVGNTLKYIRSSVNIDRSSESVNELSTNRNPIFKEETLFLKLLVEGEANLYQYDDGNLRRFFYNKENTDIEQLVYKSYKTEEQIIHKNNSFKNQLRKDLKCPTIGYEKLKNLEYNKNNLVDFFIEFNKCSSGNYINYMEKQKKTLFALSLRPGLNYSSLSTYNEQTSSNFRNVDFGNELAFRFGVEAELIMPFNKNKWSLIAEPTYQYFKSEAEFATQTENQKAKADYKSIEVPVGVRHYFFLNENAKLFVNASYTLDFSTNSVIEFESGPDFEIKTKSNLAFGLGYKHYNKYSIEIRYLTSRDILGDYVYRFSEYKTFSVIFGYSIF